MNIESLEPKWARPNDGKFTWHLQRGATESLDVEPNFADPEFNHRYNISVYDDNDEGTLRHRRFHFIGRLQGVVNPFDPLSGWSLRLEFDGRAFRKMDEEVDVWKTKMIIVLEFEAGATWQTVLEKLFRLPVRYGAFNGIKFQDKSNAEFHYDT